MNIKDIVAEYGANNLRIFITDDDDNHGFFRNPFAGRNEYKIVEKHYKITLELCGPGFTKFPTDHPAPNWWSESYNQRSFYIMDLNHKKSLEVYVLVDHDNTYQRISS